MVFANSLGQRTEGDDERGSGSERGQPRIYGASTLSRDKKKLTGRLSVTQVCSTWTGHNGVTRPQRFKSSQALTYSCN